MIRAEGSFTQDSNSSRCATRSGTRRRTWRSTLRVALASVEPRQAAISSAAPSGMASASPGASPAPVAEVSHQIAAPRVRVEIATPATASSRP